MNKDNKDIFNTYADRTVSKRKISEPEQEDTGPTYPRAIKLTRDVSIQFWSGLEDHWLDFTKGDEFEVTGSTDDDWEIVDETGNTGYVEKEFSIPVE
jgi:hypothetical protein